MLAHRLKKDGEFENSDASPKIVSENVAENSKFNVNVFHPLMGFVGQRRDSRERPRVSSLASWLLSLVKRPVENLYYERSSKSK